MLILGGRSLRLYSHGTHLNSSSFSCWPRDLEAFAFCIHILQFLRIVGCYNLAILLY